MENSMLDSSFGNLFDETDIAEEFFGFKNEEIIQTCSDATSDSDSDTEEIRDKIVKSQKQQINKKKQMLRALMKELDQDPVFVKMKIATPQSVRQFRRRKLSKFHYLNEPPLTRQRSGTKKLLKPLQIPSLKVKFLSKKPVKRICHRSAANTLPRDIIKVEDVTPAMLRNIAVHSVGKHYDAINGTTCHQCRQKTTDTKSCCRNDSCVGVRGQFCGPCLKNRYGENVKDALLNQDWSCPVCRCICNCSICRNRNGKCATGILINVARYNGFSNVKAYLESFNSDNE